MNNRQIITLDDTDKLNQEYALWLAAGVSPELLTPPTDRDHWRFCIEHIRIDGVAYEVLIDHDDDFGTRVQVVRPERTTTGQQIGVECPRCAEDTDWTCDSVPDGSFVIRCQSCDTAFPLVAGVPPEHKGAK